MSFNLADYEPVADRLARFWADHPNGRLHTVMKQSAEGTVTFLAQVWFDGDKEESTATGWASEVIGGRGVNATSALENCETSAIGRALANCNYATKGQRASREEMDKAERAAEVHSQLVSDFLEEIGNAETAEQIAEIGSRVLKAKDEKRLTGNQYARLSRAAATRLAKVQP